VAIPVIYNLRSVKARWTSAIVAVLGIAGTVGVFVAMLSLARASKPRWSLPVRRQRHYHAGRRYVRNDRRRHHR